MSQSKAIVTGLLTLGIASTIAFTSCDSKKGTEKKPETTSNTTTVSSNTSNEGRIAFVDMDTLQVRYIFLKSKKEELEKKGASIEAELARGAQTLQNEAVAFQKKAQSGGYTTQAEGEAAQQRLQKMQMDIENKRNTLGGQLMKENDAFAKELQDRLDKYLLKYNQDKKYDYILSYQKGGSILFANQSLNITEEVAKGMNEEDKAK